MSAEKELLDKLVDGVVGETLGGARVEARLASLAKASKVPLDTQAITARVASLGRSPLPLPPGLHDLTKMHPSDAAAAISRAGVRFQNQIDDLARSFPTIKKGLTAAQMAKILASPAAPTLAERTLARAARGARFLELLDLDYRSAGSLLDAALATLGDAGLAVRVKDLRRRIPLGDDLEMYTRRLAQELPKTDAPKLVRAVHEQICSATIARLKHVLDNPALDKAVKDALEGARTRGGDELARPFREGLKSLFAGSDVASEVNAAIAALDGTARARAVGQVFAAIAQGQTKQMLAEHFDANGARRLLAAYASFKKMYSALRRVRAMENLIGWLYEASKFVSALMVESAAKFRESLADAVRRHGLDVSVGEPFHHFDAAAPTVKGAADRFRQATDLIGTVPLTRNSRTVHVLATAIESKGEAGVKSGLEQLVALRRRLRAGNELRTERDTLVAGENLFFTVEEALQALGVDKTLAGRAGSGLSLDAIVVSPAPQAAVMQTYSALFKSGNVRYVAHPISRAEMLRIADDLSPSFGLLIRDVAP